MSKAGRIQNLISLADRPDARAIQSKGGSVRSPKKNEAQRLRFIKERLKRGKNTDKDVEWIMERVDNSSSFAYDMLATANALENDKEIEKPQQIQLLNIKNNIMKAIHGEKLRTENLNLNIDMKKISDEEKQNIIKELLEDEVKD